MVLMKVCKNPHYVGKSWNLSFLSTVRTKLFEKRSSNWWNLKMPSFRFCVEEKDFEKRWRHDNHVISLTEFSSNTNLKWPMIVAFFNFSDVVYLQERYSQPRSQGLSSYHPAGWARRDPGNEVSILKEYNFWRLRDELVKSKVKVKCCL